MKRWFPIAAVVVILLLAAGLYKAKMDAVAARARVADLRESISETRRDVRALRAEVAHLESPARVEALAQQQLGLSPGGESLPLSALDAALPPPEPPE
ncbi:MAG: cell division protein FtsL [Alphaproteobacteria bacterium]|nr:cell division protein FtsL [Alphaproteobacteria bacterium]